jgi:hypothetical protein
LHDSGCTRCMVVQARASAAVLRSTVRFQRLDLRTGPIVLFCLYLLCVCWPPLRPVVACHALLRTSGCVTIIAWQSCVRRVSVAATCPCGVTAALCCAVLCCAVLCYPAGSCGRAGSC